MARTYQRLCSIVADASPAHLPYMRACPRPPSNARRASRRVPPLSSHSPRGRRSRAALPEQKRGARENSAGRTGLSRQRRPIVKEARAAR
eukprot:4381357-Pleurochrysis_carterae.AAC.1